MRIDTKKISNATILTAVIVALFMMLATHLVLRQIRREEIQETASIQQNALKMFWVLLKAKGGEFRASGGNLLIGDYLVNGNNELPDQIREITGSEATIFLGDTRVATNVMLDDGRRAIGTRLTGPAYDAIFRKGVPFLGEARILGRTYYTVYDPIKDRQGKIIGVLFVGSKQSDYLAAYHRTSFRMRAINGTLTCIFAFCAFLLLTERKRSEDAIKKQLQFLQVIIDTIPSPIFYKNASGEFLGCNKSYQSFSGLSREQLLGKTVHELWHEDFADHYRLMDQELYDNPGVQAYETRAKSGDGTSRDILLNKAVFRNDNGSIGGLVGVMTDITERKAAEEEARNTYQRIADILEFLPDATFVVDQEKRVIAWNRAIEIMTGVPKEEILGQGDFAYALPFYGTRRKILIDLLGAEQEVLESSYPGIGHDGDTLFVEKLVPLPGREERYLWGVAAPLYDRQGNRVGGIETLRDMTELRRTEQDKNMLEMQLQHTSMTESLVSQLSHDLRTPLTPLFALLPLVRDKVKDPSLGKMVDICQSCVSQIQGLTTKALDLVRLSSQNVPLEFSGIHLAGVVENAATRSAALFTRRGITCLNRVDPALVVQGVEGQLALLFDNLLSNAARYGAERGVVRISATRADAMVVVSVQDDGIGLKPGHQDLIFHQFFKADPARHDLSTQGLGLAICKSIVANHRGKIWAESPGLNLGTTIYFHLRASAPAQNNA